MAIGVREAWLLNAVEHLKPIFERAGYFLPEVRVSVGFPSTGARSRHIGQCWSTSASADHVNQIFIAPQESDSVEVLDTLTHELVHAIDDCKNGHGEKFKEIALAVEGKDEDIKEGYKHRNKKQLNALLTFYKEIESACEMLMEEAKVTRKPRAKKVVPKDKLVEKLKYMKVFEPLKLVSINPTDILGCKELWIYNTKTRKLGKYIADEMVGPIGIKGSSLIGFDEHKSIQKTIRKPEEKLKVIEQGDNKMSTFVES